jgi:hypothetical protein
MKKLAQLFRTVRAFFHKSELEERLLADEVIGLLNGVD